MSAALQLSDAIEFRWGTTYSAFLAEAWPKLRAHWAEVGTYRHVLRLDPDHDKYRAAERAGILHILTARVGGELAGYLFVLILPHPRDKGATLARDDIFYVDPKFRRFRLGPAMIEEALAYIEPRADIVMLTEKVHRSLGRGRFGGSYLARYGFQPLEVTWGRVIRAPHGSMP
jgi:GNAT superfamily N-acetyltransferase